MTVGSEARVLCFLCGLDATTGLLEVVDACEPGFKIPENQRINAAAAKTTMIRATQKTGFGTVIPCGF